MLYLSDSLENLILEISNENLVKELLLIGLKLVIAIFIMYILQILIHETGHLIFGLLTGYRFLSFRIFNVVIIKEKDRLVIKKYFFPGSVGQCIMQPKTNSYFLHISGGIILNLLSSLLLLPYAFSNNGLSFIARMIILMFCFYGIAFALINGIPIKFLGIVNDGLLLVYLRNPIARKYRFINQTLAEDIISGKSYGELPYELLNVPENMDLTNFFIGYHKIIEFYYLVEHKKWDMAMKCLNSFRPYMNRLPIMLRDIVYLEMLFLSLITNYDCNREELYNKTKFILKKGSKDFNILRVGCLYDIYSKSKNKKEIREELYKLEQNYPYKGEAKFCLSVINYCLDNVY